MLHLGVVAVIAACLAIAPGCKSKQEAPSGSAAASGGTASAGANAGSASASGSSSGALVITEADWIAKDLSSVAPKIKITLRVPKHAELVKNSEGGVEIRVTPFYALTVSAIAARSIPEALMRDKRFTVARTDLISSKILTEEPNGYVYTVHVKDDAMGKKFEPEHHFAFYMLKGGTIYSILDLRPMDSYDTPGSVYSEQVARQVYEIVKSSAKVN